MQEIQGNYKNSIFKDIGKLWKQQRLDELKFQEVGEPVQSKLTLLDILFPGGICWSQNFGGNEGFWDKTVGLVEC